MSRDDPECTLDAELEPKRSGDDSVGGDEAVGVKKRSTDDQHHHDAQASAEHLREIPDRYSPRHGTKVGNDLSDGDRVGREFELVCEHSWVEILGTV